MRQNKSEKPFSPKQNKFATEQAWLTSAKDILENDYVLSANTYNPYSGEEEAIHRDPKEILGEIEGGEKKLNSALGEIKKLI